jgi:hypothetical protein
MSARTTLATFLAPFTLALLAGCDTATEPLAPAEESDPIETIDPALTALPGVTGTASGGGNFDAGVDVSFAFGVVQFNDFHALGVFRFHTILGGELVDFTGRATCLTIDRENDRAWIGGVVTKNRSTHPSFTQPINDVGRDIWFRVVDYGHGRRATQPDRTTFVGFEGGAGIITSLEYCETQPWPGPPEDVEDARTNALTRGNLLVWARR